MARLALRLVVAIAVVAVIMTFGYLINPDVFSHGLVAVAVGIAVGLVFMALLPLNLPGRPKPDESTP